MDEIAREIVKLSKSQNTGPFLQLYAHFNTREPV
jgi:hypothetical protein